MKQCRVSDGRGRPGLGARDGNAVLGREVPLPRQAPAAALLMLAAAIIAEHA
jgi:hypothetical protein